MSEQCNCDAHQSESPQQHNLIQTTFVSDTKTNREYLYIPEEDENFNETRSLIPNHTYILISLSRTHTVFLAVYFCLLLLKVFAIFVPSFKFPTLFLKITSKYDNRFASLNVHLSFFFKVNYINITNFFNYIFISIFIYCNNESDLLFVIMKKKIIFEFYYSLRNS